MGFRLPMTFLIFKILVPLRQFQILAGHGTTTTTTTTTTQNQSSSIIRDAYTPTTYAYIMNHTTSVFTFSITI
jgi:hypothetical protein